MPIARLAAALTLSLAAHLLVGWGLSGMLGLPGAPGGTGGEALAVHARVVAGTQPGHAADGSRRVQVAAAGRSAGSSRGGSAQRYFSASELDARPQIMTRVNPEYPADLVAGVRGRVVLELFLSPAGTLDEIRVARAEPPGRFEDSARKAFSGARFTPGMRKGKPVPCLLRIEVTYGD